MIRLDLLCSGSRWAWYGPRMRYFRLLHGGSKEVYLLRRLCALLKCLIYRHHWWWDNPLLTIWTLAHYAVFHTRSFGLLFLDLIFSEIEGLFRLARIGLNCRVRCLIQITANCSGLIYERSEIFHMHRLLIILVNFSLLVFLYDLVEVLVGFLYSLGLTDRIVILRFKYVPV